MTIAISVLLFAGWVAWTFWLFKDAGNNDAAGW